MRMYGFEYREGNYPVSGSENAAEFYSLGIALRAFQKEVTESIAEEIDQVLLLFGKRPCEVDDQDQNLIPDAKIRFTRCGQMLAIMD